ncbi:MAG: MCE family protein [Chitinophagales bacterium]|nr:MCE family protein [Chitinophagaceae bacterium]MCB9065143.1 MCE family protein [Chitinophagales bacterium]
MRLSKEIKIGVLVSVSVLVFFAGFYFLKGANIFSGENEYYAYYDNVQGLQTSSSVQIKGLGVGRVSNIELLDSDKVKVTLAVGKDVAVPVGTTAELASSDLLGTKVVVLNLGMGTELAKDGAILPASIESGVIDNISVELSPLIIDLRHVLSTLDTVLIGVSGVLNEKTANSLSNTVGSLDITMQNFSELAEKLNKESETLASMIRNANSIAENLAQNNQSITNIIENAEKTTDALAKAPIQKTIDDLQSASKQLNEVLSKINRKEGTLGYLVNDEKLYKDLTETLDALDLLIKDVNARPWRYINVNVFGKKNKE